MNILDVSKLFRLVLKKGGACGGYWLLPCPAKRFQSISNWRRYNNRTSTKWRWAKGFPNRAIHIDNKEYQINTLVALAMKRKKAGRP